MWKSVLCTFINEIKGKEILFILVSCGSDGGPSDVLEMNAKSSS